MNTQLAVVRSAIRSGSALVPPTGRTLAQDYPNASSAIDLASRITATQESGIA